MSETSNLKVGLLQTRLHWEDIGSNLDLVTEAFEKLHGPIDVAILPEMFSTGFSMNAPELAETESGKTIETLLELSESKRVVICGSFIAKEGENFFNRFFWIDRGSLKATYDKRHLFRMAEENEIYSSGKGDTRIDYMGWKIMPRICYDLRFPVWCRSTDVDLQIYVANWPKPRVAAWDKLLSARAIENQCYVIGVNRLGKDGNDVPYSGHSIVIDPKGEPLTEAMNETEGWIIARLNHKMLSDFRKKFPVGMDADRFTIEGR